MNCLLRLAVTVTLLLMGLNRWSHATNYRAFRVDANVQVNLTCWELSDASHLVIWMTPQEDIIGADYQGESNKYDISFDGSLVVNVSNPDSVEFRTCSLFTHYRREKTMRVV